MDLLSGIPHPSVHVIVLLCCGPPEDLQKFSGKNADVNVCVIQFNKIYFVHLYSYIKDVIVGLNIITNIIMIIMKILVVFHIK